VPGNATVSKLLKFGQQPVSIGGGARYWAESPDAGPVELLPGVAPFFSAQLARGQIGLVELQLAIASERLPAPEVAIRFAREREVGRRRRRELVGTVEEAGDLVHLPRRLEQEVRQRGGRARGARPGLPRSRVARHHGSPRKAPLAIEKEDAAMLRAGVPGV
jgi:hypothetical protein